MEDHPVMMLAVGNLGLEAVHKWTEIFQPILSILVSVAQVSVGIVTVIYIVRKTRMLSKSKRAAIKKALDETNPDSDTDSSS
jgi:hypothetical protein